MWKRKEYFTFIIFAALSSAVSAKCTLQVESTPNQQLQDNGDGTVTDLKTELMWKQCSEGQDSEEFCKGVASGYAWDKALQAPEDLNAGGGFAGHTDWRLPNIKELLSVVEKSCVKPAINSARFPNTTGVGFWSSTASFNGTWYVNFQLGLSNYHFRGDGLKVRLVRGGL